MEDLQEEAERLFATALGLEPAEREAFLDEACRHSPDLRMRVEQLLRDDEIAGSFLNQPIIQATLDPGSSWLPSPRPGTHSKATYAPQFQPNEIIANRFMVTKFIARGGMGEVYQVEDTHLRGVHVALKTILSRYALDPLMHERFKREVLMAREVVHPHVCPIYDVFEWKRPEGLLLFLTMKLLDGETLSARLGRPGRLSLEEITAITRQVGSGLAAAHEAGVLHRDIKAANIIVNGAGAKIHAWIMDFGLARAIMQDSTALTLHGVPGTPGFAAPELFYGSPPSKASDVYAFGVVVYLMFTRQLPPSPIAEEPAREELQEAGAPAPWRRMVESCLQPTPAARCSDVASALQMVPGLALDSTTRSVTSTHGTWHPGPSRRRVLVLAGATAALSGTGAWLGSNRIRFWFEPIPDKRFVALMPWPKNKASPILYTVLDVLSQKFSRLEMSVKNFMVITPRDLPSGPAAVDSPEMSQQGLGANLVLAAAMDQTPSMARLDLNLLDAQTSRVLRKGSMSCLPAELGSIPEKAFGLAAMLLQLPAHQEEVSDDGQLKQISPSVLQLYSEAEDLWDQPNSTGLKEAIAKYQKALELNPGFALAYGRLAIAYVRQFRLTQETANLTLALRNAQDALRLSPESATALLSRALVSLYMDNTGDATSFFDRALKADPGNPKIMVEEAEGLLNKGHLKEAEQVYRDIIVLRPNFWPAYNNLGTAQAREAHYQDAAAAFAEAGMAAPSVALPMANLGATYVQLGKNQDARNALRESIRREPNTDAYLAMGDLDFEDKLYKSALNNYMRAEEIEPNYHLIHRNIADCYAMLGDSAKELEGYRRAAEVLRKSMSANSQNGFDWANLAFYDAKIHNVAEIEKDIQSAEANGATDVASRFMLTQALAVMGKKDEALRLLIWCIDNGVSPADVELALDLREIENDPRYRAHLKLRPKHQRNVSS